MCEPESSDGVENSFYVFVGQLPMVPDILNLQKSPPTCPLGLLWLFLCPVLIVFGSEVGEPFPLILDSRRKSAMAALCLLVQYCRLSLALSFLGTFAKKHKYMIFITEGLCSV